MQWVKLAVLDTQAFARHDTFDIWDFAQNLKQMAAADDVSGACDRVMRAFKDARVHSVALGAELADSHGLAFWYPTTGYAYLNVVDTYRKLAYDRLTGWCDYLERYRFA